ncbi:RNA polymerase sigma factor [Lentzea sp. JNUCC 0626]|uniref:RNA polymerase sigma factor n=1 Tax=Lentzea sp. JNUCC 0626 TaxID=3367513 RepID=UPI0037497CE5
MTRIAEQGHRPDLATQDPKEVFAWLFDTYAGQIRAYLAGRVGPDEADDLVAETFLVALKRRAAYDPSQATARSWLYGIATNLMRNHVRQEVRTLRLTSRAAAAEPNIENHDTTVAARVDAEARMRTLAGALAKLTEQDRDVLFLTSWAGLEPAEVADALNIPPSTVRSKLHRLRTRLQTLLANSPKEPPR